MKPIIAVKDKQGKVYTMPSETTTCILEVHYTTSYYQFKVQDTVERDDGARYFPKKTIIVPIDESDWIDFIAVSKKRNWRINKGGEFMNAQEAKARSMNNSKVKDVIASINERIESASSDGEFKIFYSIPMGKKLSHDEERVLVAHFKKKGFKVHFNEDSFIGNDLVVRWG